MLTEHTARARAGEPTGIRPVHALAGRVPRCALEGAARGPLPAGTHAGRRVTPRPAAGAVCPVGRRGDGGGRALAEATWRVGALWRYPVKSLQGLAEDELTLTARGVVGDRAFGVLDVARATVLSAKRVGRLLEGRVRQDPEGALVIELPAGRFSPGAELDDALSSWLDFPARLVAAVEDGAARYESPVDPEDEGSALEQWEGPEGSFVDSSPLHLLTTASLRAAARAQPAGDWSVRRFRPNVLIEADGEEFLDGRLVGRRLRIGETVLAVTKECTRCVMTTRPQPDGLRAEREILGYLARARAGALGVRAGVVVPGRVRVGDAVRVQG